MVKITKNSKVEPLALALFPESSQMIKKSLEKPQDYLLPHCSIVPEMFQNHKVQRNHLSDKF